MSSHARNSFFVVGEGVIEADENGEPVTREPSTTEELRRFRFSRLGPKGPQTEEDVRVALATAVTDQSVTQPDGDIPAGFTYLGQFVDHDLTLDRTATQLGSDVTIDDLLQGRSPALDLDSLYGRGPQDRDDRRFYADDRVKLKVGTTARLPVDGDIIGTDLQGFDLPRTGVGATPGERRTALIPDIRNDENLAVAQTHLAFIRFHNRVVDHLALTGLNERRLFDAARDEVVRHYQWMLRTDFLPRIIDPEIVKDVFTKGRRFFEVPRHGNGHPNLRPTMPVEFAVATYRLGHSMVRGAYQWNRIFNTQGPAGIATLFQLFTFSGTSGSLNPSQTVDQLDDPNFPGFGFERLPSNWIVDFRRLYDFTEANRPDLAAPGGQLNRIKRIDSLLVNPLTQLPAGTFGGRGTQFPAIHRNLAFRNLTRGTMVRLATGQQMAAFLGVRPLTRDQLLNGSEGAVLTGLTDAQKETVATKTPLWFYILREAELNKGKLGPVGGRITAEVFHRSIEGSRVSIVREPSWRPTLGPDSNTFRMTDLLLFAFEGKSDLLNPLGDTNPTTPTA
ncbi:heme peroxidase family protein [Actinokineospora auranticolor]|uniref:Heme peroxidase n=1 Tax=Actinokineospora auranticolor TaxID=155976 RepID=A0A2S6GNI7_9PSEU|nr:heme peroxidase family protein [Actinokineospora auranticolor]PPK66777.1 heme peroxidase [Actinokineospora auranticolor]